MARLGHLHRPDCNRGGIPSNEIFVFERCPRCGMQIRIYCRACGGVRLERPNHQCIRSERKEGNSASASQEAEE